jgi:hypothetical protein
MAASFTMPRGTILDERGLPAHPQGWCAWHNLVRDWLTKYMFRAVPDAGAKADQVANYLSDHSTFKSHGRRVKLEHLRAQDMTARCRS